jgi:WD40 repeat protein
MTTMNVVRVFVSSTFHDMNAERDLLNRTVFPKLREKCLQRDAEFVGVDLRWGLTKETKGPGILDLCLQEIDRCRPFFIALLGARLGWVPVPETIPRDLFKAQAARFAIDDIESWNDVSSWYQLDETVVDPIYRLTGQETLSRSKAARLTRFWREAGLPHAGDSVTAREILHGGFNPAYPHTHAFIYLRRLSRRPPALFPAAFGAAFAEAAGDRRRVRDLRRIVAEGASERTCVRAYTAGYAGLTIDPVFVPADISEEDRRLLADGLIQPAEWTGVSDRLRNMLEQHGRVALSGMERLGERIVDDLWSAIDAELRTRGGSATRRRNQATQKSTVRRHTRFFVGRRDILDRIQQYVANPDDRRPLLIVGDAGAGKSAVMARAIEQCRKVAVENAVVVAHFIGDTPSAGNLLATIRIVATEILTTAAIDDPVPTDPEQLRRYLPALLARAAQTTPIVLLMDGVDQFDSRSRYDELDWMPFDLPIGTKVIVSSQPNSFVEKLRAGLDQAHVVPLGELPKSDRATLVRTYLEHKGKRLDPPLLASLLDEEARPASVLPMYLLTAVEELCLFGDFDRLEQRLKALPPTLPELFNQVLARLEHDHTYAFARQVLSWLSVCRAGLLESELSILLEHHGGHALVDWARFRRSLMFLLRPTDERGDLGVISFSHQQLRVAVQQRYLGTVSPESETTIELRTAHRELATFWRESAFDASAHRWRPDRARALSELPHHLAQAAAWDEAIASLTDLEFIGAKCAAGLTPDLVLDYQELLDLLPDSESRTLRQEWLRAIEGYARAMVDYAACWNDARLDASLDADMRRARLQALAEAGVALPALDTRARGQEASGSPQSDRVGRLRAFQSFVAGQAHNLIRHGARAGYCIQQAYNENADGPVGAAAVRCTDESGHPMLRRRSRGHSQPQSQVSEFGQTDAAIDAVAMTANGLTVVTGHNDGTVRVWDAVLGRMVRTLVGHSDAVTAVAVTPDGRLAISGGSDAKAIVWSLTSGQPIQRFEQHTKGIRAVAVTPDGALAVSGGYDRTLYVWDCRTGLQVQTLSGHSADVAVVSIAADGRQIISGSYDQTVRVWDLDRGECLYTFADHGSFVDAVAISDDGRRAVSGGWDAILRVWDLDSGVCAREIRAHTLAISSVAMAAGGGIAASASYDGTIRLWKLPGGDCARIIPSTSPVGVAVTLTADGSMVLAKSMQALYKWSAAADEPPDDEPPDDEQVEGGSVRAVRRIGRHGLVVGSADGTLRLLDGHQVLGTFKEGEREVMLTPPKLRLWWASTPSSRWLDVTSIDVSADGLRIASGSADYAVRIWDTLRGRCKHVLLGEHAFTHHAAFVTGVVFTPDGRYLASASEDRHAYLWDAEDGECLRVFKGHTHGLQCLAITPDGSRLVSGAQDETVRIWNLQTGACLRVLDGHARAATAVAVSSSGRRLASADADGAVRVWDLARGKCVRTLQGHEAAVEAVAFTRDGQYVVSAGADHDVRIWNIENGQTVLAASQQYETLALLIRGESVTVTDVAGRVMTFDCVNVDRATSRVTAGRVYLFAEREWEPELSAMCPNCGARFIVPADVAQAIDVILETSGLGPSVSPCLKLPAAAWRDPALMSACPQCAHALCFNPFLNNARPV